MVTKIPNKQVFLNEHRYLEAKFIFTKANAKRPVQWELSDEGYKEKFLTNKTLSYFTFSTMFSLYE